MDPGGEKEHSPAASAGSYAEPSGAAERPTVESTSMPSGLPKIASSGEGHDSITDVDGASTGTVGTTSTCVPVASTSRMSDGRGCIRSTESDQAVPSTGADAAAAADDSAGSRQPSEAQPQLTAAELRIELEERQAIMFVVGANGPVASGRRAVLRFATLEAVQLGWEVIRARCKAHRPQLTSSFGNFDQRVGLGWLLGDMVCGFKIEFGDALAVGTKAVKAGPDLKAAFAAPRRRAEKARYTCAEERERALEAAVAPMPSCRCLPPCHRKSVPAPSASKWRWKCLRLHQSRPRCYRV
jgi:hypothetical protein